MCEHRIPPRLPRFDYSGSHSHFVTFCTQGRVPLFRDARRAEIVQEALLAYRNAGLFWLHAYCVMPDHVHAYVRLKPNRRHLSRIVAGIKVTCSRAFEMPRCWQRGYWEKVIRAYEDPTDIARYVLMNPVRAGLVNEYTQYPFAGVPDPWY